MAIATATTPSTPTPPPGGGSRKMPPGIVTSSRKSTDDFFRWLMGIIAAVVAAIALAVVGFSLGHSGSSAVASTLTDGGIDAAMGIAILAFVGFAFWYFKDQRGKIVATIAALIVFSAVLELFLHSGLHGMRLGMLYIIAAVIVIILAAVGETFLGKIFSVAVFTILGLASLYALYGVSSWEGLKAASPWINSYFGSSYASRCTEDHVDPPVPLATAGWTNPGKCDLPVRIETGAARLYWKTATGEDSMPLQAGQSVPEKARTVLYTRVVPTASNTTWRYRLCDAQKWIVGTWDCR